MNAASKLAVLMLSLTSTWAGFEFYHQMREEDFLSVAGILCALASVACIMFGSFLVKAVAE